MWLKVGNNLHNWLALHRVYGIGSIKFQQCLLKEPDLANLPAWVQPDWQLVEQDLQWQQQQDCYILKLNDPQYPDLLKKIANPPPVLFVRGAIDVLNKQQLAIVGSRRPSSQGLDIAYGFAKQLVNLDFIITSGLALGIDAASHQGALSETNGKTLAVLGCGLDQIYPPANKNLAAKIIENGALISEFPIGVEPKAGNFPSRNRIISGLSLGVLVVEAAATSGALITAQIAAEQSREVFAIPGSIFNANARGCHKLIRQGAKLVENINDILEELNGLLVKNNVQSCCHPINEIDIAANMPLAAEYIELLSNIRRPVTSVDELIALSGRTIQEISSMLMNLELGGYILSIPGGYTRC
jgi:DNA processing protein